MQCKCGGETVERKVTEKYKTTSTHEECKGCGRIGRIIEIPIENQKDIRWSHRERIPWADNAQNILGRQ